jgi:DNA processing protein
VGERAVAVVGSRAATAAGCARAHALAAGLAARGRTVISGGAFGIDAAAHEGALDAEGITFAVLGCGVDVVYPDRHEALFARVRAAGGLLSEHPPGTPPRRQQFPSRNRIVVGLADAVVVVEAAVRSGALITAAIAQERGRLLLAVPGSPGTDRLLVSGAALPVNTADDVLRVLAGGAPASARPVPPAPYAPLLDALADGGMTPGVLARRLGVPLSFVMGVLARAEIDGWVRRVSGNHYEVVRGH